MIELRPTWRVRRWIGFVFLAPCLLPLAIAGPRHPTAVALAVLALAGYAALCVALGRRKITIDDAGLAFHGWLGTRRLPWRELARYSYTSGVRKISWWTASTEQWLADVLLRFVTRRIRVRLVLFQHSSAHFAIDSDFHHLAPVLDEVMARVHLILGSDGDRFDPLALEGDALHGPRGRLPLLAIERIRVDTRISIVANGATWYEELLHEVRNGALLLQRLAERSLPIEVDGSVTLPGPAHQAIADAHARRAAMPRAELRRA